MSFIDSSLALDPQILRNLAELREANRAAMMGEPASKKNVVPQVQEVPPSTYSFENPIFQKTLTKKDSSDSLTTETETNSSCSTDDNDSLQNHQITLATSPASAKSANALEKTSISKSSGETEELQLAVTQAKQELTTAEKELREATEEKEWMEEQKKNAPSKKKTSLTLAFFQAARNKEEPNKVEQRYQDKLKAHQQALASFNKAQRELLEFKVRETVVQLNQAQEKSKKTLISQERTKAWGEELKAFIKNKKAYERLEGFNGPSENNISYVS